MSDDQGADARRSPVASCCAVFIFRFDCLVRWRCSVMRQHQLAAFAVGRRQHYESLRIRAHFPETGIDFPHRLPLNLRAMVKVRRFRWKGTAKTCLSCSREPVYSGLGGERDAGTETATVAQRSIAPVKDSPRWALRLVLRVRTPRTLWKGRMRIRLKSLRGRRPPILSFPFSKTHAALAVAARHTRKLVR